MSNFRTNRELVMQPGDSNRPRMYVEQEKLKLFFPQWRLVGVGGKVKAAAGSLRPRENGSSYPMRIVLSEKYPYEMPSIHSDGWTPDGSCPHRYGLNQLCVMRGSQWSATYTVAFMVAKTAIWLAKYEVWRTNGHWSGNQQSHGSGSGATTGGSGEGFFNWLAGLFE